MEKTVILWIIKLLNVEIPKNITTIHKLLKENLEVTISLWRKNQFQLNYQTILM